MKKTQFFLTTPYFVCVTDDPKEDVRGRTGRTVKKENRLLLEDRQEVGFREVRLSKNTKYNDEILRYRVFIK